MALAKAAAAADVKRALSRQVVQMYRQFCRDAPRVVIQYSLEQTVSEVRHMVLLLFRKNMHVTDPRVLELLLDKARMEHEETMKQWKQRGHVIQMLTPQLAAPDAWLDEEEFFRR